MKSLHANLLPMTLAAGLVVAPMLAFAQADGTPGNPPSTMTGRAIDRATGNPTVPDGAPGNPPGTAAGRAAERVTGQATTPNGTGTNRPGSMTDRAAERSTTTAPSTASTTPSTSATTMAVTSGSVVTERPRLSQIIGGNVYNERNERVGEVDDVILATPSGAAQAPMAIIQVGGFLGMGGRLVSVPLNDLRWNSENSRIVMPGASKEALQSRAPFDYNSLRRG
ncbi:PRC-barrel domain containing protein [Roseococcus sp. SYP-B2431]|uniref:PRC-barrel domain-containing protein n=1 Tax=Roseococcus sp. SYP-B2431 TaxID=2496640 RepID=UPI0010408540|nr:PRC-barrel domain-containing protein [Roseococcus sp. SYP-B2431]TCH99553.1 PRC-barrel domain containing protein [Roseococcus sp. SYP-B2431]